jgi:murein DD-endopeptidase MepM/ murein hydrolase activator NlpD
MRKFLFTILVLIITVSQVKQTVVAQSTGPIYIVQADDTLNDIAGRFGVSTEDLIAANQLANPDILSAGMQLVIPGLEGIEGVLTTMPVPVGLDMDSLIRSAQVPRDVFIRLNRITSPNELFAGAQIVLPVDETNQGVTITGAVHNAEGLLEYSARHSLNSWTLVLANKDINIASLPPQQLLLVSAAINTSPVSPISDAIESITLAPLPLTQGNTAVVKVTTKEPMEISGTLNGFTLHTFSSEPNNYYALQGIHAMAKTGLVEFSLTGKGEDGNSFSFSQMLLLQPGYFFEDPTLIVDPATIDPANTKPEEDMMRTTVSAITSEKYWDGVFLLPVDEPSCIKSAYGNRRSYNNGPYDFFHTGVDYGVCATFNIYAPAGGVVVFAGPLTVRGNTTIIDHGQGVYSAYFHQKEIQVLVGDKVSAGDLIGLIGSTGRVTGPHLHWEIWVNGVQVQPLDWLDTQYP